MNNLVPLIIEGLGHLHLKHSTLAEERKRKKEIGREKVLQTKKKQQ